MKTNTHKLFGLLVLAASLSTSGAALAIPVDVEDPNPNITIAYGKSYTFTHNITDNEFVVGDTLDSAVLSILLRDEAGNELFSFVVGSDEIANYSNVNNGAQGQTYTFDLTSSFLTDLASDGIISVTIQSLQGVNPSGNDQTGFFFDKSTLQFTKGVVPEQSTQSLTVPEPASLALLGIGLVGLGAMRRRKHA